MDPYNEDSSKEQEQRRTGSPASPEDLLHKTRNFIPDRKADRLPNSHSGKPRTVNAASTAGSASVGAAESGAAAAGGMAGNSVAAGAAGAAGTGAGSGAAAGAAAGSVAPGAGTAIGAAVGAMGGTAAGAVKKGRQKNDFYEAPQKAESKKTKKPFEHSGTKTTALDENFGIKIMTFSIALFLALALTLAVILDFFISGIASPVMLMFKQITSHKEIGRAHV